MAPFQISNSHSRVIYGNVRNWRKLTCEIVRPCVNGGSEHDEGGGELRYRNSSYLRSVSPGNGHEGGFCLPVRNVFGLCVITAEQRERFGQDSCECSAIPFRRRRSPSVRSAAWISSLFFGVASLWRSLNKNVAYSLYSEGNWIRTCFILIRFIPAIAESERGSFLFASIRWSLNKNVFIMRFILAIIE